METPRQELLGHDGQRSPSPPPPPPSDDAQPSFHHQEPLEIKEEVGVVNQELEQGAAVAAAAALVGDHSAVAEEHEEEGAVEEEEGAAAVQPEEGPAVLTDYLRDMIVRQVEYYFSDENLPNDKFMLKHVKKDKQGFVPITVIASFRRMKRLVTDLSLIEAALRTSSQLVVSKDGRKVRRLHPLPVVAVKDTVVFSCTVIVENLLEDYSKDNLQKIFGNVGKILNITIHDPHSTEESKPTRKTEKLFSSKLHALVEYETIEAATNAVATLNDDKNWRSGMRVKLLHKRMGKYGLMQRGPKETFSEKNTDDQTSVKVSDGQKLKSDDHHDEKAEEDEERIASGKGKHRIRYRSRGWGQQNVTGQGHGQIPSGSSNGVCKPPPGPRMPDGTRGFTMGRGKPAISVPNQNGV